MKKWAGHRKGINLGGWLSQCRYEKSHYDTFITEKDIETIALWGADHVRLPIDYEVIDKIEEIGNAVGLQYINNCIAWCRKYHLNIILDLHKVPGFSFCETDPDKNNLFDNTSLQHQFLKIWDVLAQLYGKFSDFVSFELLNEIVEQDSSRWNVLATQAIQVIRNHTKDTDIVVGGIQWNSVHTLEQLEISWDEHIVYNFHFYEPFLFTHQNASWLELMPKGERIYPGDINDYRRTSKEINAFGSGFYNQDITKLGCDYLASLINSAVKVAAEKNVRLYCGEYGVIHDASAESIVRWYKDIHMVFEEFGIARAAWTYKAIDFGISDLYKKEIREKVIENI